MDIKRYITPFSVTGNEEELAKLIEQDIKPYVDSVETDPMGNLICFKKGEDSTKKTMLAAHMDEIGFVVTFIEKSGLIRVSNVGGIRPINSAYNEVIFKNGTKGVIVLEENIQPADINIKKMLVDIGAKNKKDAEKKVKVGDYLSLSQRVTRLANRRYAAKAFDDRIGCAVLAEAAKNAKKFKHDTYFVFTVQEEVGLRGSKAVSNVILPDYSVACDVTLTYDTVGATPGEVKLGGGAAIKIKDSSVICSKAIVDRLTALAEDRKIKYQYEVLVAGGTDTASMQTAGGGSFAGCISVPCRYVHSPVEIVDLKDIENCVKLFEAFIEEGLK
ncbi:MAG: M42 family metallopeptidase [Clostridiales bacterium]|jgi:endoglucanase|nr:M42 family metallopeptidase [Clostridiales bacterium]